LEAEEPAEDEEIYLRSMAATHRDTGEEMVFLVGGGPDVKKLEIAISSAFNQLLAECLANEKFGGNITVIITGVVTPDTPELRAAIERLQTNLSGIVDDITRMSGLERQIIVRVEYWPEEGPSEE